ncbi:hypothetical protein BDQ17DRAFT_1221239, partial [Cyathus striatus]
PLDHSNGRAIRSKGCVFYSPNATRNIIIPTCYSENMYLFHSDALLNDIFQKPIWWSDPYGWLSFVPCVPSFMGIFSCLAGAPCITCPDGEHWFGLDEISLHEWSQLESRLMFTYKMLAIKYGTLAITPAPPSFSGYKRKHNTREIARRCTENSRRWFILWMGLLSYAIAMSDSQFVCHDSHSVMYPKWYSYLAECTIPETWLTGIQSSTICNFSKPCLHVGIIVDIPELQKTRRPMYHFFLKFNIPFWYVWGPYEKRQSQNFQLYKALTPL